jgi:hypothetical protein
MCGSFFVYHIPNTTKVGCTDKPTKRWSASDIQKRLREHGLTTNDIVVLEVVSGVPGVHGSKVASFKEQMWQLELGFPLDSVPYHYSVSLVKYMAGCAACRNAFDARSSKGGHIGAALYAWGVSLYSSSKMETQTKRGEGRVNVVDACLGTRSESRLTAPLVILTRINLSVLLLLSPDPDELAHCLGN